MTTSKDETKIVNPYYMDNQYYDTVKLSNHDTWLKERGHGIGGSDMATVVGYNPWKTNTQLFDEKCRIAKPVDISDNPNVHYGTVVEEYLRETFKLKYNNRFEVFYEPNTVLIDKEHNFIRYSPDGLLYDKKTGKYGILEIKTSEVIRSVQREKWNNTIPTNYQIQVLHGLNVTRFDFVIVRAELFYNYLNYENGTNGYSAIRDYVIKKEDENVKPNMEWLKEEAIKFWNCVEKKEKPSLKVVG